MIQLRNYVTLAVRHNNISRSNLSCKHQHCPLIVRTFHLQGETMLGSSLDKIWYVINVEAAQQDGAARLLQDRRKTIHVIKQYVPVDVCYKKVEILLAGKT